MKRMVCGCFALALALLAVQPARATSFGTLDATLQSGSSLPDIINPGAWVTVNLGNGSSPNIPYYPGLMHWTLNSNNTSPHLALPTQFTSFCIDLPQDVSAGSKVTFTAMDLTSAPIDGSPNTAQLLTTTQAHKIAELWGRYYNTIGTSGANAAAFQLAIWKIEYDWRNGTNSDDFSTGNFRATTTDPTGLTALGTAKGWLDYLNSTALRLTQVGK
jgi:hypothetical protein